MKTTVELSDAVLHEAKRFARENGTTLKSLMEEGLRMALERRQRSSSFRLRDASVDGKGLHPDLAGAPWSSILEVTYEGRGG